jgi:hypothetical protein
MGMSFFWKYIIYVFLVPARKWLAELTRTGWNIEN